MLLGRTLRLKYLRKDSPDTKRQTVLRKTLIKHAEKLFQ